MTVEIKIEGVEVRHLKCYEDSRGWLAEIYRSDEIGSDQLPRMVYISMTKPGAVRGPHEHRHQTDYFCFTGTSRFILLLWDNRPDSVSFGQKARLEADENEIIAIRIPPGVVHAYKNISVSEGLIINAPDKLYAGKNRAEKVDEIRYEDDPESEFKAEF